MNALNPTDSSPWIVHTQPKGTVCETLPNPTDSSPWIVHTQPRKLNETSGALRALHNPARHPRRSDMNDPRSALRGILVSLAFVMAILVAQTFAFNTEAQSLREAFKDDFLIGASINRRQFFEEDERGVNIIKEHFNSITPENTLKWALVHPRRGTFDFQGGDRYVAFGEKYKLFIVGHTLIWHNQTPPWVFQDDKGQPVDRNTLLRRMREHILTVVGRYKGRIRGWDVVNEALNEDGTMRQSPWLKIIGDDYIVHAFEFAHEADPQAELYYNDYSLENEPKRKGAIALIKALKVRGVPIAAVGLQGHDKLDWPSSEQQDATITAFAKLGVRVNITELDVSVLP